MAKIVQLKKGGVDTYPRTLDSGVLVSGTTLLSDKLHTIDDTFDGMVDGTIVVGSSASAMTDNQGNVISSTYVKETSVSSINDSKIRALFI